jgi:hypothetical protein
LALNISLLAPMACTQTHVLPSKIFFIVLHPTPYISTMTWHESPPRLERQSPW